MKDYEVDSWTGESNFFVIFSTACLAVHVQNYVWLISRLDVLNNFLKTGYGYFSDEANYGFRTFGLPVLSVVAYAVTKDM